LIVDGLDLGTHEYIIVVGDQLGLSANDTVLVIVVDTTPPITNHPSDVYMNASDTGRSITWIASDLYPAGYQITRNGSVIEASAWSPTKEQFVVSLDGLETGTYAYRLVVVDLSGNWAEDSVFVTVDRPADWWDAFSGLGGSVTIIVTIGSLAVIVVFSALICSGRKR
jgi:hypothetical protein